MRKPGIIKITDGNFEVVKTLAVFFKGSISEYAVVLGPRHYLMISRERFKRIIDYAETQGYYVFDYTLFD